MGSKGFWAEAGDSKNQDAPARRQGVSLTQKTQKNAKARVAQISYCSDGKCVMSEPNHLRISFLDVELHRNNATAISYTWGEFYREPVYIGHTSEGKALHMELGKEWIRDDVIRCLAELGGERPCWIDQLCIPQTDQEIRNVLAKIPSIYRSFDVTVLMPGSPCSCLERFLELSIEANERLDSVSEEEHLKDFLARMQPRSMCLNGGGGLSSWFFRVWTRQELLYSNRIHVTWVAKTKAKCVMQRHGANVEDLAPFAANMYACLVRQGMRSESAQYKLISFASKVGVRAASDLLLYNSELPWELEDALFFFLSGEVVQRGPPSRRIPLSPELKFSVERDHRIDAGEAFRFYHFLDSLTGLRGNRFRVATRARDYVVSIWVDCPRYALPAHQKEMTAPEYLQDAFEQLHRTFSVTIASYAPRGLFKSGPGSALWDPVTYLANADIRSGAMLYGPIALEGTCVFLASPTKVVPLHRLGQGDRLPISSRAVEYHQAFKETDSGSIINVMRDSFTHWAISADMGFSAVMEDYMEGPDFQDTTEFEATLNTEKSPHDTCNPPLSHHASFGTYLERSPIPMLTRIAAAKSSIRDLIAVFPGCSGPSNPENALKECAIPAQRRDDVIYEVVASALGLDPDVCRIHGLRVMIARGEAELPTRIGLFRGDVDLSAVSESKAEGKVLTVCVAQKDLSRSGPWRLGIMTSAHSVLYEALRVNGDVDGKPAFEVFGVWVPTEGTDDLKETGAVRGCPGCCVGNHDPDYFLL